MTQRLTTTESVHTAARRLAAYNIEAAPETQAIYLFPADHEIRLVETDPTTLPSDEITPYYFGADPRAASRSPRPSP